MKKSIVSVFVLTLLFLFSCDFDAISKLIDKASVKLSDRDKNNIKNLKYGEEEQEGQETEKGLEEMESSINNLGDRLKKVAHVAQGKLLESVNPVNEVSVRSSLYPFRKQIEIKKEDLVPSTDEEKEAEQAIQNIKNSIKDSEFSLLIENVYSLKNEYYQMSTVLYNITNKIRDEIELLGTNFRNNREKRQALNRLQVQLKNEIFNIEDFMNNIDIAIGGMNSAKSLFEKAKKTLNEAITRRLQRAENRYLVREYELTQLSRDARRYAESSLRQLESSSLKMNEGIAELQRIKKFIEEEVNRNHI